jgi:predicted kinase
MKKLILVCGPAGIGKSTFCQNYTKQHPLEKVVRISSDEIRLKLTKSYRNFPTDKNGAKDMTPVYQGMVDQANQILQDNNDVTILLDSTMLYDERRLFFVNNIKGFDEADLDLLKLHDYSLCFKRNHERIKDKWVPDEVIADMIKSYEDPQKSTAEHFQKVESIYLD